MKTSSLKLFAAALGLAGCASVPDRETLPCERPPFAPMVDWDGTCPAGMLPEAPTGKAPARTSPDT